MKSGLQTRCCGMRIPTSKHGELKCAYCLSCTSNMFCFHGNVKFCRHGMYTLIERVTRASLRALLSLYPFVPFHNFFLYNQWVRIYDRKLEYKSKMKLILLWNWFDYVYIYSHYLLATINFVAITAVTSMPSSVGYRFLLMELNKKKLRANCWWHELVFLLKKYIDTPE